MRLIFLLLTLSLGLSAAPPERPRITTVTHLDRPHFRIETRAATYLYDIAGGGLSSLIDPEGNDWIDFKMKPWGDYPAAAASAFRGVPNLVYQTDDGGAGHPGHDRCESRVVGRNQIHTITKSGKWAWTVTFFNDCVRFEVVKTDPDHAYWFLYEGTPGGKYRPRSTYWATDLTDPSFVIHDFYKGDHYQQLHQYMMFGRDDGEYSLFMYQDDPDTHTDHISYLGNEEIGAENSPDGMVVAGLGRAPGSQPLMTGRNTFLIGLLPYNLTDEKELIRARRRIERLSRRRTR